MLRVDSANIKTAVLSLIWFPVNVCAAVPEGATAAFRKELLCLGLGVPRVSFWLALPIPSALAILSFCHLPGLSGSFLKGHSLCSYSEISSYQSLLDTSPFHLVRMQGEVSYTAEGPYLIILIWDFQTSEL